MTNLVGNYQIAKSNLVSDTITLVIGTRKKPEITKPKNYLLLKLARNGFEYVSSLYPVIDAKNTFEIDYLGIKYVLNIADNNTSATIGILQKAEAHTSNPACISIGISAVEVHSHTNTDKS